MATKKKGTVPLGILQSRVRKLSKIVGTRQKEPDTRQNRVKNRIPLPILKKRLNKLGNLVMRRQRSKKG